MDKKIGEILLEKRLIDKQSLENALHRQEIENSKIGKILMSENIIRPLAFHRAIAEKYGVQFVDLTAELPNPKLLRKAQKNNYFAFEVLPWREDAESITLACSDINDEIRNWAVREYPYKQINFVVTSPLDILWSLQKFFEAEDNENARFALFKKAPNLSAQKLFSKLTLPVSFLLLCFAVAGFASNPQTATLVFTCFMNVLFFGTISFKLISFLQSYGRSEAQKSLQMGDADLPIYTILVPLYREKETIANLINAIDAFDYPKSKLDVKLVVETDDKETIQIIKNLCPPAYFEIIRTPFSLPRTKPKACNYALQYARGEFVTVYDAEDIPNKYQLKTVLQKFAQGEAQLACVQARLNYYNYDDSQITRWFALEYATWFDFVMKGLEKMNMAIPLGGTSNHIRARTLHEIGGWDAFNVTEDADLGMRLKRFGYSTGTVDSITMEEATNSVQAWLMQRKRWIKGFMQTYIVHMRQPIKFVRQAGLKSFLTLQFFIGFPPLLYLLSPLLLLLGAVAHFGSQPQFALPDWLQALSLANFAYGAVVHIAFAIAANFRASNNGKRMFKPLIFSAVTFPFYSILHVLASFGALRELLTNPHYWEKTQHGLSKNFEA